MNSQPWRRHGHEAPCLPFSHHTGQPHACCERNYFPWYHQHKQANDFFFFLSFFKKVGFLWGERFKGKGNASGFMAGATSVDFFPTAM